MPSSAAASARVSSTSGRVVPSIIWSFPPTSYSRLCSAGCAISSACGTGPRCSCCCGWEFTHEAVREWEERFAPLLIKHLRCKRKGKVGRRWYVDETYLKVKGKWCYLYRAIDRDGNLVDSMLSATRDMAAAQ